MERVTSHDFEITLSLRWHLCDNAFAAAHLIAIVVASSYIDHKEAMGISHAHARPCIASYATSFSSVG